MEKLTSPPALQLLHQAHILPNLPTNAVLLDNACGGGVLTATLFKTLETNGESVASAAAKGLKIICGDLEPKMVANVSSRIQAKGWEKIASSQQVDAQVSSRQTLFGLVTD